MTGLASSTRDRAEPNRLWLRLGSGSALIYLAFLAPGIYSLDGNSMLAVAQSIVVHGSFAVSPTLGVPGLHGHFYSPWYPLLSLLAVPFVGAASLGARFLHLPLHYCAAILGLVLQSLITAATVSAVAALASRLGAEESGARLAGIAFGFGTIAPVYSRTFFSEPLLALLTALAVLAAIGGRPWIVAIFAALAVLAKPSAILLGLCLSLYAWFRTKGWRSAIPAAGTLFGVIAYCFYNELRFGRFEFFSLHPPGAIRFAAAFTGITGLLFSPGFGLVWFCPVVIVACTAGILAGAKSRPRETAVIALICLGYLTGYGSWTIWQGGWSWGPRFLLPVLAILAPFVGLLAGRWRKVALALVVLGLLVSAPTWISFYERIFARYAERNIPESAIAWSPLESPLLRAWPTAWHELRDAEQTNPRELIRQAEVSHSPSHSVESSRALRILAVWWWLLPAIGISRWWGALFSLALVSGGVLLLLFPNRGAPRFSAEAQRR